MPKRSTSPLESPLNSAADYAPTRFLEELIAAAVSSGRDGEAAVNVAFVTAAAFCARVGEHTFNKGDAYCCACGTDVRRGAP